MARLINYWWRIKHHRTRHGGAAPGAEDARVTTGGDARVTASGDTRIHIG